MSYSESTLENLEAYNDVQILSMKLENISKLKKSFLNKIKNALNKEDSEKIKLYINALKRSAKLTRDMLTRLQNKIKQVEKPDLNKLNFDVGELQKHGIAKRFINTELKAKKIINDYVNIFLDSIYNLTNGNPESILDEIIKYSEAEFKLAEKLETNETIESHIDELKDLEELLNNDISKSFTAGNIISVINSETKKFAEKMNKLSQSLKDDLLDFSREIEIRLIGTGNKVVTFPGKLALAAGNILEHRASVFALSLTALGFSLFFMDPSTSNVAQTVSETFHLTATIGEFLQSLPALVAIASTLKSDKFSQKIKGIFKSKILPETNNDLRIIQLAYGKM